MSDREQVERELWEFMEPNVGPTGGWLVSPKKFHAELVNHTLDARAQWLEEACRVIESLKTGNHWQNDNTRDKCIAALRTAFQGR